MVVLWSWQQQKGVQEMGLAAFSYLPLKNRHQNGFRPSQWTTRLELSYPEL
jgi:hypothetical protein